MEIQATGKRCNSGQREKLKKKGFSGDGGARGVDGRACRQQTHLMEEARVKTVLHASAREFKRRTGDRRVWARVGTCDAIFRRGFHRKVDQREALLLVCSSAGMEVIGKFRRKKLSAARFSDDGLASVRIHEDCSTTGL